VIRDLLRTACWLLPPSRAKNRLLSALGHPVHPTARAGMCLVLRVAEFSVGADTVIGHGNVFRSLRAVRLGADVILGQLNWLSVAPTLVLSEPGHGVAVLGDHAVLSNRHYLDCSGGLWLGEFATIAGIRSTVLTHSVDLESGKQTLAPVVLDRRAFVGTNCVIMPGTRLAERAVLATGSVTTLAGHYGLHTLHGGVPAKPIRPIDGAYFHKDRAWISQ
jgi:acetyltransferase-like isoleucine patch superfamily enzyme